MQSFLSCFASLNRRPIQPQTTLPIKGKINVSRYHSGELTAPQNSLCKFFHMRILCHEMLILTSLCVLCSASLHLCHCYYSRVLPYIVYSHFSFLPSLGASFSCVLNVFSINKVNYFDAFALVVVSSSGNKGGPTVYLLGKGAIPKTTPLNLS